MGVGASTAAGLENPFPIEPAIEKDLLRLSFVVSRLLNKPDLYDLNNLARPGACGDYAVFLKDKLEKRLMPFIADISGGAKSLAVVYQNPLKAFDKVETRKEVCQSLANTMVRLVSIVVACLASLQFESPRAREAAGLPAAVPTPVQQRGGQYGDMDIIAWLTENGYGTAQEAEGRHVLTLKDPGTLSYGYLGATPSLILRLNRAPEQDGRAYAGYISSSLIPDNYLKVYIMKPIQLSAGGLRPVSVLPIHVVDNTGLTWLAGALHKNRFLSFSQKRQPDSLIDSLNAIFRKALPTPTSDLTLESRMESRESLMLAEQVFIEVRRLQNVELLQRALAPFLSSALGAYYPGGSSGIGPQAMGFGGLSDLLPRRPPYGGFGLPTGLGPYGRPGELAAAEYVVPPPVAKAILTTFRKHSGEIGAANNPAQIRATLLAGNVLRDRTIQTRICQDPYWISTTMASIYPWAALQFLCIEDYKTLATAAPLPGAPLAQVIPAPVAPTTAATGGAAAVVPPTRPLVGGTPKLKLSKEWADFVTELRKIYDGDKVPSISVLTAGRDGENPSLEELRFVEINKVPGCVAPGVSPRARFQEIQNGVLRLQGLYEEHSKEVWKILNSLIFVIEDPDSKAELVRLNPQIFASGVTTSAFIEEKAEEARTLLAEFYLEVEKVYTDTIRNMRTLS